MSKKIARVGVIGAGGIARNVHLPSLNEIENAKVVAICDLRLEKAKEMAEKYNIPSVYWDMYEMMEKEELDCIFVLVEPDRLFRTAMDVLKNHIPVIMEKPAGISSFQSYSLARIAKENNTMCAVAMNRRHVPVVQYVMKRIRELDLPGYAIGGLAVGEDAETMYDIIETVEPYMPTDKPRYLMGVGTPQNIVEAVYRGVDFFDCVMPSRNARHGNLFTWEGKININNEQYFADARPISKSCGCPACKNYSRAYIRHLFKAKEALGMRLAVLHNLYFYNELMQKIRDALDEGRYEEFYREYRFKLAERCVD